MIDATEYYGLVLSLARKTHRRLLDAGGEIELDDLVQEGFVGLLEAADKYQPGRGTQFATFAYPRIDGAIKDYLRRLDLLSQQGRQQVKELSRTKEQLRQSLSRDPVNNELAQALGVSEEEVGEAETLGRVGEESVDGEGGQERTGLSVPPLQDDDLAERELGKDVDDCLEEAVDAIERKVLVFRFWEEVTLQKIGDLLGRPLQTVFSAEQRARRKMRECLEGKGWEIADVPGYGA